MLVSFTPLKENDVVDAVSLQSSRQFSKVSATRNTPAIAFSGAPALKPILIMVVDDEETVMTVLSLKLPGIFTGLGYTATIEKTNSPAMALRYMNDKHKQKPDLFFVDKKMPHEDDGAKLVATLLAEHKVPIEKIIFQSGGDSSDPNLEFVLYKPYNMDKLKVELKHRLPKK